MSRRTQVDAITGEETTFLTKNEVVPKVDDKPFLRPLPEPPLIDVAPLKSPTKRGPEKGWPNWNNITRLHQDVVFPSDNEFDIPMMQPYILDLPSKVESFTASPLKWRGAGVHFYREDWRFESVWNNPARFLDRFKQAHCVFTPDFSIYSDWPRVMQMWNVFRNRWLGCYWGMFGIPVIPTVSWGNSKSYDFAFLGVPKKSVITVATVGCYRDINLRVPFEAGLVECLDRLEPKTILWYGHIWPMKCLTGREDTTVVHYSYHWDVERKWNPHAKY